MTDEERLEQIKALFAERGYELNIHEVADVWRAAYIRSAR
jgi:hypothetical protein